MLFLICVFNLRLFLSGKMEVLSFFVQASDHGTNPQADIVSVSVYLTTNTDSIPRFTDEKVTASVVENVDVGSEVG